MKDFFHFKQFSVRHRHSSMKVGTDGVLLGAWASAEGVQSVLDIGTGTGVIALMMAQRTGPTAQIDAVEVNEQAAHDAADNFMQSPWRAKLTLHPLAIQEFSQGNTYDLIITNPPFFTNSYKPPDKNRQLARHTDTLTFAELLSVTSNLLTKPSGRLAIILPWTESHIFKTLALTFSLHCIRECAFRTRQHKPVERVLMEFSFQPLPIAYESICLYESGEVWTSDYIKLTRDYYLKI
jgi:tRNA1Val (adenine37-N6)-methyltransferase